MAEADTNQNPTGENESNEQNNGEQKNNSTSKTFSQEEVNNVVSKRINEINAKNEEKMKKAIQEAKAEWEKQSQMSDEEKQKEEMSKKEQEIAERERNLTLQERSIATKAVLQDKGMPTELADYLIDVEKDTTDSNVEKISKVWDEALSKAVEAKVAGETPKDSSNQQEQDKKKYQAGVSSF